MPPRLRRRIWIETPIGCNDRLDARPPPGRSGAPKGATCGQYRGARSSTRISTGDLDPGDCANAMGSVSSRCSLNFGSQSYRDTNDPLARRLLRQADDGEGAAVDNAADAGDVLRRLPSALRPAAGRWSCADADGVALRNVQRRRRGTLTAAFPAEPVHVSSIARAFDRPRAASHPRRRSSRNGAR